MQGYTAIIILMAIVVAYAFRRANTFDEDYSKGWYVVDALVVV